MFTYLEKNIVLVKSLHALAIKVVYIEYISITGQWFHYFYFTVFDTVYQSHKF